MTTSTPAFFKIRAIDGAARVAVGTVLDGPTVLLSPEVTFTVLTTWSGDRIAEMAARPQGEPIPGDVEILAPTDGQEVWAAGVTYESSRLGRIEEAAHDGSVYDRIYTAERPELFFKAAPHRVRGPGDPIGIRYDSTWDAPEPELAVLYSEKLEVVGYSIGNDVSSRSLEGENPLYLPQAKIYQGSCSIGPALVPSEFVRHPLPISMEIRRGNATIFEGATSTSKLRRTESELGDYLGRCLSFPHGVWLLTGTSIVPPADLTLHAGDEVAVAIAGLGELTNPVEVVDATAGPAT